MSLPDILPTGALASGDYVDYMIGYNNSAADSISSDLEDYHIQSTIDDWHNKWDTILGDVITDVAALESSVSKIKSQVRMIEDAIDKL